DKKKLDAEVARAKEKALSMMGPKDRRDFERDFEIKARFSKDKGALKYNIGYEPTAARRERELTEALARGLHERRSAEAPYYSRRDDFVRPSDAAGSMAWW